MKIKIVLLSLLAVSSMRNCHSAKPTAETFSTATWKYQAFTRGFFETWELHNRELTVKKGSNPQAETRKIAIDEANWHELCALAQKVDWATLPDMQAPSTKHRYDGAAGATLEVSLSPEGSALHSVTFDHNNAPAPIQPFLQKIESLIP